MNDGGPAFPQSAVFDANRGEVHLSSEYFGAEGMSLRDHFAGLAMAAIVQAGVVRDDAIPLRILRAFIGRRRTHLVAVWWSTPSADQVATRAYAHADAMLAERAK